MSDSALGQEVMPCDFVLAAVSPNPNGRQHGVRVPAYRTEEKLNEWARELSFTSLVEPKDLDAFVGELTEPRVVPLDVLNESVLGQSVGRTPSYQADGHPIVERTGVTRAHP